MSTEEQRDDLQLPKLDQLTELTRMPQHSRACHMAAFLVGEDDAGIYLADLQGTWILPHGSYENLGDWSGGADPPEMFRGGGRPVQLQLVEDAVIYEIRPWNIRKGGDPIATKKNREIIRRIFSAEGDFPSSEVSSVGEDRLLALEEAFGRRLGWDPERRVREQVFFDHHLHSASWNCGSDGGGS